MKRNVQKYIDDYNKLILDNMRQDMTASEMEKIGDMSKGNLFVAIMNAFCFGFAVGYRCKKNEKTN